MHTSNCADEKSPIEVKGEETNINIKKKSKMNLSPQTKLYFSQFLSSWGDRMWMFSGGLFLIELTPGSFRLVAIYEAILALTVILMGSPVGRWVDRKSRLTAAQCSLLVQNSMVCSCTLLLCFAINYQAYIAQSLNGWGSVIIQVVVIFLAGIAEIGTLGSRLSIEKDWIVVISKSCNSDLSTLNSVMRTLDLSTEIIAPVIVGTVMSFTGVVNGGIVIGAWNAISMTIEYYLLHHLYTIIPDLQIPKIKKEKPEKDQEGTESEEPSTLSKLKDAVVTWKAYFTHNVRNAGLSFALLFMSVVALDNFARVYLQESGVSAALLGILTAAASLSGIAGSVIFPLLHKRYGTVKSGLFGFVFESTCLLFCVASIFAPGSLFVPSALWNPEISYESEPQNLNSSLTVVELDSRNESYELNISLSNFNESGYNHYYPINMTDEIENLEFRNASSEIVSNRDIGVSDYTSVALLLTGIISSRLGLWVADLATTQILQERVAESERGGINGVQYSLNKIFTMLRAALLIILPSMQTFGYLVLMSFSCVFGGTVLYSTYAYTDSIRSTEYSETENSSSEKPIENKKPFSSYEEP